MDHPEVVTSITKDEDVKTEYEYYCERQQKIGQVPISIVLYRIFFILNILALFCFMGSLVIILLGTIFEPLISFVLIVPGVYFCIRENC